MNIENPKLKKFLLVLLVFFLVVFAITVFGLLKKDQKKPSVPAVSEKPVNGNQNAGKPLTSDEIKNALEQKNENSPAEEKPLTDKQINDALNKKTSVNTINEKTLSEDEIQAALNAKN